MQTLIFKRVAQVAEIPCVCRMQQTTLKNKIKSFSAPAALIMTSLHSLQTRRYNTAYKGSACTPARTILSAKFRPGTFEHILQRTLTADILDNHQQL